MQGALRPYHATAGPSSVRCARCCDPRDEGSSWHGLLVPGSWSLDGNPCTDPAVVAHSPTLHMNVSGVAELGKLANDAAARAHIKNILTFSNGATVQPLKYGAVTIHGRHFVTGVIVVKEATAGDPDFQVGQTILREELVTANAGSIYEFQANYLLTDAAKTVQQEATLVTSIFNTIVISKPAK